MQGRRVLGAIVLSVLGLSVRSAAEDFNRWDSVGPNPTVPGNYFGGVGAVAVDRSDSSVMYAGNSRALYRSVDGGSTWQQVLEDRVPSPIPANFTYWPFTLISIDPTDPSTVFAASAGGSVFRSRDDGASWLRVVLAQGVASLLASPGGPDFACVTQSGRLASLRSIDSGLTWTEIGPLTGKAVQAFVGDAANPGRVWAAVAGDPAGAVVYLSEDGGATWSPRSPGLAVTTATALTLNPEAPDTLYVATDAGLFRTEDAGQVWTPVGSGLPKQVTTLAAGPGSAVYAGTNLEGLYRSSDGGAHWTPVGLRGQPLFTVVLDPSRPDRLYAGGRGGLFRITWGPVETCVAGADALCLQEARFLVRTSWRTRHDAGIGQAILLTPDTGAFWFFEPDNIELAVKVLDGRSFDGWFWVFYGALSNVEYVITVLDTSTGAIQSYVNPQGWQASVADTSAFRDAGGAPPAPRQPPGSPPPPRSPVPPAVAAACEVGPYTVCLQQGRFRVEVEFTRTPLGPSAPAPAEPLTADTGYFWFFDPANIELVVKVLDGREFNGHFWVFYGALSNVEYQITVTDTLTGDRRTYHNERGNLASVADTSAF